MGTVEDEIRIEAEDALAWLEGLDVRRMFSGWGFYRFGLLFAAAWDGEFRFRARRDNHWTYEAVDRTLLQEPERLEPAVLDVLASLEKEPDTRPRRRRGHSWSGYKL